MADREQIIEALKQVMYPGFDRDIITLGAVDDIRTGPDSITITLKKISADEATVAGLSEEILLHVGKVAADRKVNVVHGDGKGGHDHGNGGDNNNSKTPFQRKTLPGVKHIVPVTSGKGGVGKSTVAVNLAHTVSELGSKVGILDLDIFGPSVHKMLGTNERLAVVDDMILPVEKYGLKLISIGMAVDDAEAMILRGPMVMKVIDQLINQVNWGELDYLFVDLPPGTGDVPLSLTQQLAIDGAVVVTTPQDVALIDVRRSVSMYKQTQTRILGIVENMSYYVCGKCGEIAHLFGEGGGAAEAESLGVPLLGSIPLVKSICTGADNGSPVFNRETNPELAKVFESLAERVKEEVAKVPAPLTG